MAKNFTLTCPATLLSKAISDFDVLGKDSSWARAKTKALIESWLTDPDQVKGTTLKPVEKDGEAVRMLISFGGASELVLSSLTKQLGLAEGEVCKRIIAALADGGINAASTDAPEGGEKFVEILRLAGFLEVRPEQVSFYLQNKSSLENRKIGLSEAATGTGKTAAMLMAAAETACATNSRVAITVPTISLIHQFRKAWLEPVGEAMSLHDAATSVSGHDVPLRCIYGRREFVSEHALISLVDSGSLDKEMEDAARSWMAQAIDETNGSSWLISSLEQSSPALIGFPSDEVRLQQYVSSDDRGFIAYRLQMERNDGDECEIVVFTHAMLGVDFRGRLGIAKKDEEHRDISAMIDASFREYVAARQRIKEGELDSYELAEERLSSDNAISHREQLERHRGTVLYRITESAGSLPPYRFLMVDECHLFEQSLSNVLSDSISIRALGRELKEFSKAGGKVTKKTIAMATDAIEAILDAGPSPSHETSNGELIYMNYAGQDKTSHRLLPAIMTLSKILEGVPAPAKNASPDAKLIYVALRRDLSTLRAVANGAVGIMSYSPVRRFPQLTIGKPSLELFLKQLWAYVEGASCVSATVYLPKGGSNSGWYMKSVLSIPSQREAEYSPNVGGWIVRPVVGLWQPDNVEAPRLVPPSSRTLKDPEAHESALNEWHQAVIETICDRVVPQADGGILCLTTSYQTAKVVGDAVASRFPDTAVITAVQGVTLQQQREAFLKATKDGCKTVWVATGAAWTGLDAGGRDLGIPAYLDNVITDLIIPRLPFNTNRSITHQHRKLFKPSINWEFMETAFFLLQGLGRLVRRVGLPQNRKIWVLDGRLVTDPRMNMFNSILNRYRKAGSS